MRDEREVLAEYEAKGYKYIGNPITSQKAYNAYVDAMHQKEKYEYVRIGRNLDLVLLHDRKQIVEVDSGD